MMTCWHHRLMISCLAWKRESLLLPLQSQLQGPVLPKVMACKHWQIWATCQRLVAASGNIQPEPKSQATAGLNCIMRAMYHRQAAVLLAEQFAEQKRSMCIS